METYFHNCYFRGDKTTFHYLNPDHNGTFRIPGETEIGNEFTLEGRFVPDAVGFVMRFHEEESGVGNQLFKYDVDLSCNDVTMSSQLGETIVQHEMGHLFKAGRSFFIHITTSDNCYEVTVNKEDTSTHFKVGDTVAVTLPHYVTITGDIQIRSFHIKKNSTEKVTYHMTIPGKAKVGDVFTFYGKTPVMKDPKNGGPRLMIEFLDAPGQNDNVWFHFNPRFEYHYNNKYETHSELVRNSYIDKKFGEKEISGKNPLSMGQLYTLEILVEKEHFRCWINDVEYCTYKHRLPFQGITKIKITNKDLVDTEIMSIIMSRVSCRTPKYVGYQCTMTIDEAQPSAVTYFPKIPMNMNIQGRLGVGSCICISGVFKKARSFKCDLRSYDKKEILDFRADFDRKTVKLFGDEKPLEIKFPFHENGHFHMQIFCADHETLILTVDEMTLNVFKPDIEYSTTSEICIAGDVRISVVAFLNA